MGLDDDLVGLHLVEDLLRDVDEGLVHVLRRFRRRLVKEDAVLLRELLPLLCRDDPRVLEVRLVPDEHDRDVLRRVLLAVLQPRRQVLERLPPRDVVHEQRPHSPAVVAPRDAAELLLPRSVPDLQLHLLPVHVHGAAAELDPDGQVVHRLETLVGELEKKAGLADGYLKIIIIRRRRKVLKELFGGSLPESPTMMYLKRYLYGRAARFLGGAAGAGADAPQPIFCFSCLSCLSLCLFVCLCLCFNPI